MHRFSSLHLWLVAFASLSTFSALNAEQATEIRNKKRSMANGETTVFAAGETKSTYGSAYRGGLGVNFPSGSAVRLLIAERPSFERILPGEKLVTTAATTSSGGYNTGSATSDSTANFLRLKDESCSVTFTTPIYTISFSAKLDSENKNIENLPAPYVGQYRAGFGTSASSAIGGYPFGAVTGETMNLPCAGGAGSLPISCYIQGRVYYDDTTNPKAVTTVGRVCTCTGIGSCTVSDFVL